MAKEFYSNAAPGFLNGAILSTDTSATLVSSAAFPSTGNFTVKCDLEIMLVTANASNVLTITRGQEGTTAAAHADTTPVYSCLTDGSLRRLHRVSHGGTLTGARREINLIDGGGVTFTVTDDSTNDKVDISATVSAGGNPGEATLVAPVLGNFTWLNQGTGTVTSATGSLFLRALAAAGDSIKGLEVTPPATPWTAIAKVQPFCVGMNYCAAGMYFRNSSASTLATVAFITNQIQMGKFTNPTTFSASYAAITAESSSRFSWLRLQDDGTNRIISASVDGTNWIVLHTIGRTDFLTADRVGWFADSNNATYDAAVKLLSWNVTTP